MELRILNTEFQDVDIIDSYESLIWTERYRECGDFELCTSMSHPYVSNLMPGYYLTLLDSDHTMIIEDLDIKADPENGAKLIVTGRSLESILDRRIAWYAYVIEGNVQSKIESLFWYNIGEGAYIRYNDVTYNRRVSNFVFQNTTDPAVADLTCERTNLRGENLYNIVSVICKEKHLGFRIVLNSDNQFVFSFYSGVDRSYNQNERPYVVFSPNYDNLASSNYVEKTSPHKNAALILGAKTVHPTSNEETDTRSLIGDAAGLDRREIFVDATKVSTTYENDNGKEATYTRDEYIPLIEAKAYEALAKNVKIVTFDGECETTSTYRYRQDFGMGDIVQIEDEYGHQATSRVVELIRSSDSSGEYAYPTFESIEEGE